MSQPYYLVLVRETKSDPWRIHFGDYDRHIAREEADDYRDSENLEGRSANVRVAMVASDCQADVDAFVNARNADPSF